MTSDREALGLDVLFLGCSAAIRGVSAGNAIIPSNNVHFKMEPTLRPPSHLDERELDDPPTGLEGRQHARALCRPPDAERARFKPGLLEQRRLGHFGGPDLAAPGVDPAGH